MLQGIFLFSKLKKISEEIDMLTMEHQRIGVTLRKGVTLGNVTMKSPNREVVPMPGVSTQYMIGLPRAQHQIIVNCC
ncbi:hypothetical protein EVAR_60888_1 [Eumeta japonica]|uniref:Uncharacterized protein n=1 Tax=Eumeta variegata TaxID=151549 RepID=A0A4C1YEY9_EUMVA|nr:hypothetical protein EVAR_60888_1 [Eumeta japonica]